MSPRNRNHIESPQLDCATCSRPVPVDAARGGFTRFHIEGSTLDRWGTKGVDDVGAIHFRDMKPCDEIVGVQAALYDSAGEPVTATAMLDIFGARRQLEQLTWPGAHVAAVPPTLPKDSSTWDRIRTTRNMRVTMGTIRYTDLRARELYADNFAQGFPMPRDFESAGYAPVIVVMYRVLTASAAQFECAIDYRKQAYCAA